MCSKDSSKCTQQDTLHQAEDGHDRVCKYGETIILLVLAITKISLFERRVEGVVVLAVVSASEYGHITENKQTKLNIKRKIGNEITYRSVRKKNICDIATTPPMKNPTAIEL